MMKSLFFLKDIYSLDSLMYGGVRGSNEYKILIRSLYSIISCRVNTCQTFILHLSFYISNFEWFKDVVRLGFSKYYTYVDSNKHYDHIDITLYYTISYNGPTQWIQFYLSQPSRIDVLEKIHIVVEAPPVGLNFPNMARVLHLSDKLMFSYLFFRYKEWKKYLLT